MLDFFKELFNWVIQFLPGSPFQAFIAAIPQIPYLAEFNWFFPVGEIISIMEVWLVAVGLYFLYSAVLRFIHLIG